MSMGEPVEFELRQVYTDAELTQRILVCDDTIRRLEIVRVTDSDVIQHKENLIIESEFLRKILRRRERQSGAMLKTKDDPVITDIEMESPFDKLRTKYQSIDSLADYKKVFEEFRTDLMNVSRYLKNNMFTNITLNEYANYIRNGWNHNVVINSLSNEERVRLIINSIDLMASFSEPMHFFRFKFNIDSTYNGDRDKCKQALLVELDTLQRKPVSKSAVESNREKYDKFIERASALDFASDIGVLKEQMVALLDEQTFLHVTFWNEHVAEFTVIPFSTVKQEAHIWSAISRLADAVAALQSAQ